MEFIDHTGHIFSMPFYSKFPIGYEYETNPYIFWLDSEYTNNLSINTYYIRPIYALFNETDNFKMGEINITVDSKVFKLIGSKQIQDLLEENKSFKENIELSENKDLKSKLVYNDFKLKNNDLNILKIKKAIGYKGYKKYPVNQISETRTVWRDVITGEIYKERNNNFTDKLVLRLNDDFYIIFFDDNYIDESEAITYGGEHKRAFYYVRNNEGIFQKVIINPFNWNRYFHDGNIKTEEVIYKGIKQIEIYHPIEQTQKDYTITSYIKDNQEIIIEGDDYNQEYFIEEIENYISEDRLNEILEESNNEYEFVYKTVYKDFILIPFYVIGLATEEGTWTTNVLINVSSKSSGNLYKEEHYTHITVGGVFKDNIEELVINGKNMGVYLPKDILKAIYSNSFYSDTINEELYNEKVKEYLMNFMVLKGEQGNFKSALASLQWFGWGDKIDISKLLQTDNLVFNQYIRDYFSIKTDIIESYKLFRNSTYISLSLKENRETEKVNKFKFNEDFWGENKPVMENLFDKSLTVTYDEGDIIFYKSYYDFVFNEIGLKLTALKYYYQKYFLPIHLHIKTASIEHKVYLNDIKHITAAHYIYNERPCMIQDNDVYVEFSKNKNYILEEVDEVIDENYNIFNNTEFKSENNLIDGYKINYLSVKIPIKFTYKSNVIKKLNNQKDYKKEYYDCILILKINGRIIYNRHFSFIQDFKDESTFYRYFLLCPKLLTESEFDITYWINNKIYVSLFVNGKFFEYNFTIKEPIFNLELGRLKYQYYIDSKDLASYDEFNQITPFDQLTRYFSFKSFIWDSYKDGSLLPKNNTGNLVLVNDIDFYKKLDLYKQDLKDNQFNVYYIEEELLLKNIDVNGLREFKDIYERKSFKLNNPLSENINYLYYYDGDNIYKKLQKVNPYFGIEIPGTDYILHLEKLYQYDKFFSEIEEVDSLYTKSKNNYYAEIKNILSHSENIDNIIKNINPMELWGDIDIYEYQEYEFEEEIKKDFVKVNDINSIVSDKKYYIKLDVNNLNYYCSYYDVIKNEESEEIIVKFEKRNDLIEYNYNNTINGYYDYIDNVDLKIFEFNERKDNKYIFIKDFNLYTKENKTWYNLLKLSTIKPNIINDSKYLNRILLFDLYKDSETIYKYNKFESLDKLYEKFFYTEDIFEYYLYGELIDINNIDNFDLAEEDKEDKKILYVPVEFENIDIKNKFKYWYKSDEGNFINLIQNDELSSSIQYYTKLGKLLKHRKGSSKITLYEDYPYDMYLMHDNIQWFCIFISRETIGNNNFGESKFKPKEKEIKVEDLTIKYIKGSNRFLINRYRFIPSEGINHFNDNEIIVCSLTSNDNLTFKKDIGYKWEVIPKSIGITDKANVFGNTNTLIFSIGKDNIYYEKGYYTIKIKYSIDDYIQHQKEKSCIVKIE